MCALKSNTEYVIFRGLGNLRFSGFLFCFLSSFVEFALVARPFELWVSDDKLYP